MYFNNMKNLIYVSLLLLVAYASASKEWEHFKTFYGKSYKPSEELLRKKIYEVNLKKIIEHNRNFTNGKTSFIMKVNEFSDMTPLEITSLMTGFKKTKLKMSQLCQEYISTNEDLPESKDWREEGAVTAVKNQGVNCGSCWAFSATGSLEGQHFLKTGQLVSLSEQNLVDCSREYGNEGCDGGLMDLAFEYIRNNKGIDTEESYPYEGEDNICRFNPNTVGATVQGCFDISQGDEAALKNAVALIGPISAAVVATDSFHSYGGGIFKDPECGANDKLNHAILIVGYGSEEGQDYWIIKNSWGESWGDQGYMKLARNINNHCSVASAASYPTVPIEKKM